MQQHDNAARIKRQCDPMKKDNTTMIKRHCNNDKKTIQRK